MFRKSVTSSRIPVAAWRAAALVGIGLEAFAAEGIQDAERAAAALFSDTNVARIRIEISPQGMAALRATEFGEGQKRPTVVATVKEGGLVYTNVAIHLKGWYGSFRPLDDNPCFTLNFEKNAPGQTFHGLRKLSLNNSVQDRSFLSEKICRELFDAAGTPTPRAAHAMLELNGRNLHLRVLTEGFNKQFLKRYFKNTKGNLFESHNNHDITDPLEVNSGDDPDDRSGVKALIAAMREPDRANRFARLEQTLDMNRFLSYMAMEVITWHWDGYMMNRNNFRIFHDLDANKIVFIAHGMDQMFGHGGRPPDYPIFPPAQGVVARAVLGTVEGRRRYLERLAQLSTNVFRVEAVLKRVDELAAVIRPLIAESGAEAAKRHDQQVQRLKTLITQRDESLKRQLAAAAGRN